MQKLLKGIKTFYQDIRPLVREQFAQLALNQRPDVLMIACSDSRVVPNLFASTDPGDLFVVRNVGNIIPPLDQLSGEAVALEFALTDLPVKHIIICGHTECGACKARFFNQGHPFMKQWLEHASPPERASTYNQLAEQNVLFQLEKLKKMKIVEDKLSRGEVELHAWMFDIAEASVLEWNGEMFELIK